MLDEVGLPITVGVARTKFLAKVASGVAKPDGLLVVPPDGELASCTRCRSSGCGASAPVTVAQAARRRHPHGRPGRRLDEEVLTAITRARRGPASARARAQPRPAAGRGRPPKALDRVAARARPREALARELDTFLVGLIDRVARRLRKAPAACSAPSSLRLRFDDFTRATRSHTLPEASDQTDAALATARALLASALPLIEARGITLIGVSLSNLEDTDEQLVFSFDRKPALDRVLDTCASATARRRSRAACWSAATRAWYADAPRLGVPDRSLAA